MGSEILGLNLSLELSKLHPDKIQLHLIFLRMVTSIYIYIYKKKISFIQLVARVAKRQKVCPLADCEGKMEYIRLLFLSAIKSMKLGEVLAEWCIKERR